MSHEAKRTQQIEKALLQLCKQVLNTRNLTRETQLVDVASTSLKAMELYGALIGKFGAQIPMHKIADMTIGQLAQTLAQMKCKESLWSRFRDWLNG